LRLAAPRSGISLRSTCIFSFVFQKKLVTFKALKTKNKTAYATIFKQQPLQQKPQPSGGCQTPE
jgi:hypothetical protein